MGYMPNQHPRRDWKVTVGHRLLSRAAGGALLLAVYGVVSAITFGDVGGWWVAAAAALGALLLSVSIPAPIPRDLITGEERWVDWRTGSATDRQPYDGRAALSPGSQGFEELRKHPVYVTDDS